MSMPQRKRNWHTNFSPSEIGFIADEVRARQSVLFGPFSSIVTNTAKIREWDEIATKLNACSSVQRSGAQIRKKWNDYKSQVKKKAIDVRRESCKTGGGPAPVGLSDLEHKVVSMIPQCQIEGITGGLESEVEEKREAQPGVTAILASEKERTGIMKALLDVQRKILAVSEQRLQVETDRLAMEREKFEFKKSLINLPEYKTVSPVIQFLHEL
ncbi:myb-related transcription factor, partner of profilin-like [Haliotis rubra]|uniref:myb-related transcription factor, partner of profilin-like n=1 Tax=Haliotis rubra TaxID=36100 RepID=UPI001EE621D6|nr:myb-related transcription factor, partner of profilin-like [Haliotis rubra]